jgi:hypothetical protein
VLRRMKRGHRYVCTISYSQQLHTRPGKRCRGSEKDASPVLVVAGCARTGGCLVPRILYPGVLFRNCGRSCPGSIKARPVIRPIFRGIGRKRVCWGIFPTLSFSWCSLGFCLLQRRSVILSGGNSRARINIAHQRRKNRFVLSYALGSGSATLASLSNLCMYVQKGGES